jgi:hypothetical protein
MMAIKRLHTTSFIPEMISKRARVVPRHFMVPCITVQFRVLREKFLGTQSLLLAHFFVSAKREASEHRRHIINEKGIA